MVVLFFFNTGLRRSVKEKTKDLEAEIIEKKKIEDALRDAVKKADDEKEKTEAIIAGIGEGISIQDTDFKIMYQNQIHKDLTGDHIGEYCFKAYRKNNAVCDGCGLALAFQDGKVHRTEQSALLPEGIRYVSIISAPIRDSNGNIVAGVESVRDVTKQTLAEQCLRESEERVSLILNSAAEGIYGLDMAGNCSFCNESALRILGYRDEKELVGKNIHELIHHTKADGTPYPKKQCMAHKVIEDGEPIHNDAEVLWRADGSSFQAEYWAYPIHKEGKIIGSVITFVDITKRIILETQLVQAQKMESVGTLAGGIAHDFNNILSAIIGYANIALMSLPEDSPQRIYMEHILEASDRAAGLTRNLLTFSRKQMITRRPLEMNTILKDIEKLLITMIGEDIEVSVKLYKGDLLILGDQNQISQVFINLATNARDAMPKGGSLTISLDKTMLDESFTAVYGYGKPGEYVLLTVTDTGDGMDEKTRQRIFEPFFTTKEVGKGTGLGMAIIYGIIKQHDGYINVYSEPGRGTTFRIYIPLAEEKAVEDKKETEAQQPQRGTETILLAEDDEFLRKMIVSVLERFGYEVIMAFNGEEAVRQFREHKDRIDLLLFDMVMPRKNGREAYDEIRMLRPDIPVIFSSGYAADVVFQKGLLEEGMTLIYKPVSPNELLLKIRQVLGSRNAE